MLEMKDSRIPWIGKIPQNWKTPSLKYITDDITDFTASGSFADLAKNVKYLDSEDYAMLIRAADLSAKRKISHIYINKHAYDYLKKSNLYGGELILPNIGSVGTIYRYTPLYKRSTLAPNSIMIKSINNHFLYYLFDNGAGENALKGLSNATTQSKFNKTQLRNLKVILPPKGEQKAITDFLDSKCADIDSLTGDIQKQIEILKEYKKSIITRAVTKGLDPNVEMKDSGIEWIGRIPKTWNILPLYMLFSERKNRNSRGKETNLLSLSYGRIIRKNINTNIGLLPESFNTYNIVEKNDIIIRPTDLQNDKKSLRTGLVKEHGIITSAYIALMPLRNINSIYFHYLLHAYDVAKVFYNMGNGVRQGLNYSEFCKLLVVCPNRLEQQAIVDSLDTKCADIDAAIEGKQKQLDVLKEYKKSLIYEYVTGKKEVPCCE